MTKPIDDGWEFPDAGILLDELETKFFLQVYKKSNYPTGKELRKIAEDLGGYVDYECQTMERYDAINIQFSDGLLRIERPWVNLEECNHNGHKIIFYGEGNLADLETEICSYLVDLHITERKMSKKDFLEYDVDETDNKDWVKEVSSLF